MMFINTMIFGTLMAISSYSWMSMWLGLEINLLSIIPLLSKVNDIYPSEAALKYFLTQSLASLMFLFSIILSSNLKDYFILSSNSFLMLILNSALLTKMGAAPFHFWFPEIIEGLKWINCFIILTWQKIAPMILLMYNLSLTTFLSCIIIISSMIGSLLNLNQISLRKILVYSSINHMSWMIAAMLYSPSVWMIYFIIYTIISLNIILMFNNLNIYSMKQLLFCLNSNKMNKLLFMMNFMSLGGLPPFLGFLPKWLTVNNLIYNNFYTLSLILIITTLISLFVYLRIMFSTLMFNSAEIIFMKTKMNISVIIFNFISIFSLIFYPYILTLF
uniref:NADH-ubiquinone oxidoreductase chain 2 n=1 Tax=Episcapha fortunii TaxID=2819887 RepID=A0A977Q6Z4_9CUCU|nr:NADH dehydrogenase subunit 2 [Episcapha fortunii]UXF64384.1 NADH dehydrogenase subunit 2 [Episcapha fortunii]